MNWEFWLPWVMLLSSLVTGLCIFVLREEQHTLRAILNMGGSIVKVVVVAVIAWGTFVEQRIYEARMPFLHDQQIVLRVDDLSLMLAALSSVLWLITTIYAIGYLENAPHRRRFFGFFSLCVTATIGIALAGNLITFLIFYEMLSVTTYPLVVHRGTEKALSAGRTYLLYTLSGGVILMAAIIWLQALVGPVEFVAGGSLAGNLPVFRSELITIFGLLIVGLGVKAALFPLHHWLPEAMVAPAPVSALLHAVAVVKAGAYGIVRVVYDVYGLDVAEELGVLPYLAGAASFTILYGSVRALTQTDLKKRLAYSTVSQVSYITLGTALLGPLAAVGALVHLVHQGIMKITLFFCAGIFSETLGVHKIHEVSGIGKRLPLAMTAFTLAAFGMIGVPPLAGFVTKWFLGLGGLQGSQDWVLAVLVMSGILNAAYFLPIVALGWFGRPSSKVDSAANIEASWALLGPALCTAILALAAGLFASSSITPLALAELVAAARVGGR